MAVAYGQLMGHIWGSLANVMAAPPSATLEQPPTHVELPAQLIAPFDHGLDTAVASGQEAAITAATEGVITSQVTLDPLSSVAVGSVAADTSVAHASSNLTTKSAPSKADSGCEYTAIAPAFVKGAPQLGAAQYWRASDNARLPHIAFNSAICSTLVRAQFSFRWDGPARCTRGTYGFARCAS